jgi:hypothetical protein
MLSMVSASSWLRHFRRNSATASTVASSTRSALRCRSSSKSIITLSLAGCSSYLLLMKMPQVINDN